MMNDNNNGCAVVPNAASDIYLIGTILITVPVVQMNTDNLFNTPGFETSGGNPAPSDSRGRRRSATASSMTKNPRAISTVIEAFASAKTMPKLMKRVKTSKKEASQACQKEMEGETDLPIQNSFSPLQTAKQNSPNTRPLGLRDLPAHFKSVTISSDNPRPSVPKKTRRIYRVTKNKQGQREVHGFLQPEDEKQEPTKSVFERLVFPTATLPEAKGKQHDDIGQRVPVHQRLTYPEDEPKDQSNFHMESDQLVACTKTTITRKFKLLSQGDLRIQLEAKRWEKKKREAQTKQSKYDYEDSFTVNAVSIDEESDDQLTSYAISGDE